MSAETGFDQECSWSRMGDNVLRGESLSREVARQILDSDDSQLLAILDAAYRLRRRHFGTCFSIISVLLIFFTF